MTPIVNWDDRCPQGLSIAHFMCVATQRERLLEDLFDWEPEHRAQYHYFEFQASKLPRLYLVSHWPRRAKTASSGAPNHKQQSNVIMQNVAVFMGENGIIEEAIPWDKYELLICIRQGANEG